MVDSPLAAVKMYRKISHEATDREEYPTGHPKIWAGKPHPVTQTYAKLCHARDVPDMDAFSRIQFREDNGRRFNGPNDIPTILLTKGSIRNWLGKQINPPSPQVSYTWWNFDDETQFMTVHETGTNEFQPLLPTNIRKKGRYPFSPHNGTVITTSANGSATTGTEPMMKILESTLLGPVAGTNETGRRLVAYQMQMPTKGPNKETDNSKIMELSDTLEIVYEGMYHLLSLQKEPAPIDITITMTWVTNKRGSGVYQRYKHQPYLRITISFDSNEKIRSHSSPRINFLAQSIPQTATLPARMPSPPRIWNGPRSSTILCDLHALC